MQQFDQWMCTQIGQSVVMLPWLPAEQIEEWLLCYNTLLAGTLARACAHRLRNGDACCRCSCAGIPCELGLTHARFWHQLQAGSMAGSSSDYLNFVDDQGFDSHLVCHRSAAASVEVRHLLSHSHNELCYA